jgi:hypothetical protein
VLLVKQLCHSRGIAHGLLALQQLLVLGLAMSGMALKVVITCLEAEDSIRRVDVP